MAIHFLVWIIFFFLPFLVVLQMKGEAGVSELTKKILFFNASMTFFWALVFYLNSIILIPRFLFKKKYLYFSSYNILLLVSAIAFNRWIYTFVDDTPPYSLISALFFNGFPFLFFLLLSIAFKTVSDRLQMERIAKEREQETLKTELAFLRSQISPHFLLNVLNSMAAMVRLKSDMLEPTILRLSSILQYILYETDGEKVLLKSEVDYLKSYILLQQTRFGDRLELHTEMVLKEDWHVIEPMLLIPFVENAFKHGSGMMDNPVIEIKLQTANNRLSFMVRNKYIDNDSAKDNVSGIGLVNVKRRLELLYGNKQILKVDKSNGWYTVTLDLYLEP